MRKDINKVLCERERRRSKDKFHNYRSTLKQEFLRDPEGASGGLLTKGKIYGYDRKDFNENLNPLKGFLRKSVGRPWDDIYSELSQSLDRRSVINQHVFDHLMQYVAVNTMEKDGKLYVLSKYSGTVPIENSYHDYYVHPVTRILVKVGGKTYRQKMKEIERIKEEALAKTYREINAEESFVKLGGSWFHVKYRYAPKKQVKRFVVSSWNPRHSYEQVCYDCEYVYDVVLRDTVGGLGHDPKPLKYAYEKHQVSSTEIKRHRL